MCVCVFQQSALFRSFTSRIVVPSSPTSRSVWCFKQIQSLLECDASNQDESPDSREDAKRDSEMNPNTENDTETLNPSKSNGIIRRACEAIKILHNSCGNSDSLIHLAQEGTLALALDPILSFQLPHSILRCHLLPLMQNLSELFKSNTRLRKFNTIPDIGLLCRVCLFSDGIFGVPDSHKDENENGDEENDDWKKQLVIYKQVV